jgi:hypothetical protein
MSWYASMEKIGFLKEIVFEKIGRIHSVDEVEEVGDKVKVKAGKRE